MEGQTFLLVVGWGEVWEAVKGTTCLQGHGTAHLATWNHVRSLEHLRAGWALLPPSQSLSWLLPARLPGRAGGWPACSRPPVSSAAHLSLLAAGPCSETSQPCQTAAGCMLQQRSSLHLRHLCGTKFFLLLPLSAWDEDQFLPFCSDCCFPQHGLGEGSLGRRRRGPTRRSSPSLWLHPW